MKLKDFSSMIHSTTGNIQFCIVYDSGADLDIESGCSAEYAYKHYGDRELKQISADGSSIVFHII